MTTTTASGDEVKTVFVRRTESSDAQHINDLIDPTTVSLFGTVNVIYLLEKANLAVTLITAQNEVLAHAAFFDHPIGDIVDAACWEPLLQNHFDGEKCTPLNTLFLHLFVEQPGFSTGRAKEIIRTVFNAVTELQYICLVTPFSCCLEPALEEIFEPMKRVKESQTQGSAFVCHRHNHCPRLHIRKARVEDCDDLTDIFAEQTKALSGSSGPNFLAELIETQDEENHAAVCESDGAAVGFISVSGDINLRLLNECFELGPFNGLLRAELIDLTEVSTGPDGIQPAEGGHPQEGNEETELIKPCPNEIKNSIMHPDPSESLNAFCIQLFVIDKRFEMRSTDFLPYIFKLFPDRDFCVISVPKLAPEFPLLQSFQRVVPRATSSLPQELYLFHRSGLLKTLVVRVAVTPDMLAVQSLVQSLSLHESILEDLDMFLKSHQDQNFSPLQAFVAQVQGQIVGIIIIRTEEDIEYIRANYNIENFIYFSHHRHEEHGQLCHFALNPIFQHYAKHFLKEALRLAHKSCLYYPIYPSYHSQQNACAHSLTAVLNCMVPVRPRKQIIYPLEELGINAPSKQITKEQVPYALNHTNRKLTMEPKVSVNARVVVVGASDTGLSFLETLVFCPHLRFNNLTLISTHGLPGFYLHDNMRFLATSHGYSDQDHAQLSLRSWINVVTGKMIAIDRATKHVRVTDGKKVPYDYLILCTGVQYQMPCLTGLDSTSTATCSQVPVQSRDRYTVPSNLFTLNDQHDCAEAYHWLLKNFVDQEGNAVVYGNTIDAYTCVETLLCLGISGTRIHLVHMPTDAPSSCFNNPTVAKAVERALEKREVHIHPSCLLAQLNDGQATESLTSVSFTTDAEPLHLECSVFMNFSWRGVDYDAFKAINEACLVFDGRLVIDATFHTNDVTIRAAGPLTKFARRYHASWLTQTHANFNSKEVGQALAAMLLPFFDPTLELPANPPPDQDCLIPIYSQAMIQGGRLPGGYNYLHVTKPAVFTNIVAPLSEKQGREIFTGRIETGNYFQLHLNQYSTVESITCLSVKPLPVSNYLCLYDKHERLLNHLCSRYDEGLVHDLYSYFQERWCLALYHDRFTDFEQEVRQIMDAARVEVDNDSVSVPQLIQMLKEETLDINEEPSAFLKNCFKKSEGLTDLKRSTLNFLKYNRYHLPMYAKPGSLE